MRKEIRLPELSRRTKVTLNLLGMAMLLLLARHCEESRMHRAEQAIPSVQATATAQP